MININDLSSAIMEEMEKYAQITSDTIKEISKQVSSDTVKELKTTSPNRTGRYAAGWRSKKTHETSQTVGYVIHNKDRYQLSHLLEKSHGKRNGGRTREQSHIEPAERQMIEAFMERLENEL